uniref:Uncharacterized protein n=1 Tax=Arundo donax TaxID=35708 RepID=A0A0A9SRF9_ARUDO
MGALFHWVHIVLTRVPVHVWELATAKALLNPYCSIEGHDPAMADRSELSSFGLMAWTA